MNAKSGGNTQGNLRRSAARIASAITRPAAINGIQLENRPSSGDFTRSAQGGTQVAL
jgi:hypothetical protein